MLLLAHLERESNIPTNLQQDLKFVLQKTPPLLEEMLKIATLPRPPHGCGWLVGSALNVWIVHIEQKHRAPWCLVWVYTC